jgi:NADH:ubiquinone oxidoreductase subunit F (NADH-binding)/(2Fe-2S) ferredoxin/Pyruvate/2-oxoacid:ferredoxin oxidoreductase delta subunit
MNHSGEVYQIIRDKLADEMKNTEKDVHCIIHIGSATCENAAGADAVRNEFTKLILASGRQDILIKQTGCTGRCAREPIVGVFVKGQMPFKYERVTAAKVQKIFQEHVIGGKFVSSMILDKKTTNVYSRIVVFCSSYCNPSQKNDWPVLFPKLLEARGLEPDSVRIYVGGCFGLCPTDKKGHKMSMLVMPDDVTYEFDNLDQLDEIIQIQFAENKKAEQYIAHLDPITERFLDMYGDVAFFNKQTRLTLRNSGLIDPESLSEYIQNNGYEALAKTLDSLTPQDVISEITASGLRGRGGGGYPTGRKWANAVSSVHDSVKYIVCNADEGDPGAFMDRSTLEGDPFSIIEGMTIGAFAIGAKQGYIYIRAEYPLAIKRCRIAIDQARKAGLLGKNILESDFDFDIDIRLGAGAYVCGEETALMHSIEGERGQPVIRPPYPTTAGLWGHPTVINNVETLANIPVIIMNGAKWFARIGTATSTGTKVFALAGKVNNTGLVEVPMGTSLRDIIFEIGGGIPEGRAFKAVQTGGPSGGCLPAAELNLPVDYDSLGKAGSIMGSGGMIILDEQDCMVATAQYFLEFTQSESCGKCVPCREGTLRMLEILRRITDGAGVPEDIGKLERLSLLIKNTSLCGLGQNAPNPVLSVLKNFREEFEIHIHEKRCPSHKCKNLIHYEIDPAACTGCTLCARKCPVSCISGSPKKTHLIDLTRCIRCGECYKVCRFNAVKQI